MCYSQVKVCKIIVRDEMVMTCFNELSGTHHRVAHFFIIAQHISELKKPALVRLSGGFEISDEPTAKIDPVSQGGDNFFAGPIAASAPGAVVFTIIDDDIQMIRDAILLNFIEADKLNLDGQP